VIKRWLILATLRGGRQVAAETLATNCPDWYPLLGDNPDVKWEDVVMVVIGHDAFASALADQIEQMGKPPTPEFSEALMGKDKDDPGGPPRTVQPAP
jgi:hypothetical protein